MKALSKRRGRSLKQGVARTDSGYISRAKGPGEAPDKQARETRMRLFGVKSEHAATAEASTALGRLSLMGIKGGGISPDQYNALKEYRDLKERFSKVIGAPDSLAKSGVGGMGDSEGTAEITIRKKLDAANKVITDCQNENRHCNLYAALSFMVLKDELHTHMIGDIRILANALHRHFFVGVAKQRKSVYFMRN